MNRKCLSLLFLVLSLGVSVTGLASEVEKQGDAKAQLKFASALEHKSRGLKGEDRKAHLKSVAEAYAAVPRYFAEASAECTEAAFRLGSVRRSLGDRDAALIAFEKAVELKGNRKFAARALLEIAHLSRRAKNFSEAAKIYEKLPKEFGDLADQTDTALIWAGKMRLANKENDAARLNWQTVAEKSNDPIDRVKAFDLIASSYIAEGKNAEATQIVDKCRTQLLPLAEDSSAKGLRVKKALQNMKSASKLNAPMLAKADEADGDEDED